MKNRRNANEWTALSLSTSRAGYLKAQKAEREIEAPEANIDALASSEKPEYHFCSPARAVPGVRIPPMGIDRTTDDRPSDHMDVLIAELQDRIPALEEVNSENRCIIAVFTSRIRAIEAPSDDSGSPETSSGGAGEIQPWSDTTSLQEGAEAVVEVPEADRERCMGGLIALAASALTLMSTLLRDNAQAGERNRGSAPGTHEGRLNACVTFTAG
jgi:hypothetical protein